ncbi:TPA: lipocalin family protein [Stenotrophomonas maltophilia]|uniref:lipocalin family protein n=1 Tax=Stenotrophomonas sp. TaxID=69392 RepID=UPI0028B05D2E|nr:lipocalin family protein [Stenotrophomonas sp.]HDS0951213.1 lipocalin family protein [Stenotrophomonas maltophilia]HDS1027576.1 lipocalin family protein [Stenotrophomonas maltophilia]HDS1032358.1 lipocalin family protein [Stenotrophomonas maltophilia]HDS1036499.1 lipocalin family protein [Stenotrophomonas maltophilia]HDS1039141.1 lipocalin family protein [Stenotrophomonas maltophilia]
MSSIRPFCAVLLALSLGGPALAASDPPSPRTAASGASEYGAPIDLQRFMGTWYVIGRVPNFIERGHVASVNEYALREDNKVAITYRYRDGFGEPLQEVRARASVDADSGNHAWRTWFYRIVPTHSRVLEVAPDYSWAMIGYPGREMAWIFARQPDMDKALYKELAERLRDEYGVNTDKLKRVPQHPEQVGKLGYEVPNVR